LQCLIHSGHNLVSEYIVNNCCITYKVIESKHKFKNKGIAYLISLVNKDWEGLIKQKAAERSRNQKMKKQEGINLNNSLIREQDDSMPSNKYFQGSEAYNSSQKKRVFPATIKPLSMKANSLAKSRDPSYDDKSPIASYKGYRIKKSVPPKSSSIISQTDIHHSQETPSNFKSRKRTTAPN
jgi:hypothetical protein